MPGWGILSANSFGKVATEGGGPCRFAAGPGLCPQRPSAVDLESMLRTCSFAQMRMNLKAPLGANEGSRKCVKGGGVVSGSTSHWEAGRAPNQYPFPSLLSPQGMAL